MAYNYLAQHTPQTVGVGGGMQYMESQNGQK